MCVCVFAQVCVYIYMYACIYLYIFVCRYMFICACVHIYVFTYIYILKNHHVNTNIFIIVIIYFPRFFKMVTPTSGVFKLTYPQ